MKHRAVPKKPPAWAGELCSHNPESNQTNWFQDDFRQIHRIQAFRQVFVILGHGCAWHAGPALNHKMKFMLEESQVRDETLLGDDWCR